MQGLWIYSLPANPQDAWLTVTKPCKRGHTSPRNKYGQCKECQALLQAEARKDPDQYAKKLAWSKAWSDANRQRHRELSNRWSKDHSIYKRLKHLNIEGIIFDGQKIPAFVLQLLDEQGNKCSGCLKDISTDFCFDHVIATANGGDNTPENIQLLCVPCNSCKKNHPLMDWLTNFGVKSP